MILAISESDRKGKRYKATYKDGNKEKILHFGSAGATTYLDGATDKTRDNYRKRHLANPIEKRLIQNLIVSPALLAMTILWGESRSLETNLKALNTALRGRGAL